MKKILQSELQETVATVLIFEKVGEAECADPIILMGQKTRGYGKDKLMFPGGHVEPLDPDIISAARREGREETGLDGKNHMVVAKLEVIILEKRVRFVIHVILFSSWRGELKWSDEFEKLEFLPLSQILTKNLLPGEKEWMTRVLLENKPAWVRITCGKDREHVLQIETADLPG